jgi:hypothetical protein
MPAFETAKSMGDPISVANISRRNATLCASTAAAFTGAEESKASDSLTA